MHRTELNGKDRIGCDRTGKDGKRAEMTGVEMKGLHRPTAASAAVERRSPYRNGSDRKGSERNSTARSAPNAEEIEMDRSLVNVRIAGITPCLMQSDYLVNPLTPEAKRNREINAKKTRKTDDDRIEQSFIEYKASLYYDNDIGPYWPAANILRCLRDAAKMTREGKDVERGLDILENKNPLIYDGPRTPEELFKNLDFVDCRSVIIAGKRVMRYRPIFHSWELQFGLLYDRSIFRDLATVRRIVEAAGRYIGLSTYRPKFGQFEIVDFVEGALPGQENETQQRRRKAA